MNAVCLPAHELEILTEHVLGAGHARRFLNEIEPSAVQTEELAALAARREAGEPLQYITGIQAFRKLELAVGSGVLVPRPETEMVVERCLELLAGKPAPKVIDIGAGSGAIALAIATERPDCSVWATNLSKAALEWAHKNAAKAGAHNVEMLEGDLFGPVPAVLQGKVDLVVSNPPYLSDRDILACAPDVSVHEPRLATVAGPTGLEVHRRIIAEAGHWLKPGGHLVLETFGDQWVRLKSLLLAGFTDVAAHPDLSGSLRIAEGRKQ